jgi:hypothetical protein
MDKVLSIADGILNDKNVEDKTRYKTSNPRKELQEQVRKEN